MLWSRGGNNLGPAARPRCMSDIGRRDGLPPILRNKDTGEASVFTPESLLREARRQKSLQARPVPEVCILDPDGDLVRHLRRWQRADRDEDWACYHTELYRFEERGTIYGIIGCAVGGSFAVLLAEELFACGCGLLVSVTSAGQILPVLPPPYFIVIDRALRDEGTSYHYQAASEFSVAAPHLVQLAVEALSGLPVRVGATWTTDAPFRETASAIDAAQRAGILAVEMEAASLYAFAAARERSVLCLAHVTNQMGRIEGDFEKGAADGAEASLRVLAAVADRWRSSRR
jgi:uridine phosphorylase